MIKHIHKAIFVLVFCLVTRSLVALDVSVTHATYLAGDQPYTEFYLHVVGNTLTYDSLDTGIKAKVMVTYILSRNDSVISADRIAMNSPTFQKPTDFAQMIRKSIPSGDYEVKFEFQDALDPVNDYVVIIPLKVKFPDSGLTTSDLRFLASFDAVEQEGNLTKHGFYLEPLPYNLYHKKADELNVYCEIYDFDQSQEEAFGVIYGIQDQDDQGDLVYVKKRTKRFEPEEVNVLLSTLDISDLPSGNYLFKVELVTRKGELIESSELPFMRSNPEIDLKEVMESTELEEEYLSKYSDDSLNYYLKSLVPVVSNQDVEVINFLLDKGRAENKRIFIHRHFDQNFPQNPGRSFKEYAQVARAIDRMYNDGFGYGFESDRGRIYLKYGRPSQSINIQDDEGAFPYEIWYYDQLTLTNQRDVRFLFYNPDYTSNRYLLLTSTCRQEKQLRQWELELYRNAPGDVSDNRVDANRINPDYRRRARELYTQ